MAFSDAMNFFLNVFVVLSPFAMFRAGSSKNLLPPAVAEF